MAPPANSTPSVPQPQFPTHNAPRVWVISAGDSPIGISVARQALEHGDCIATGVMPAEVEGDGIRSAPFKAFLAEVGRNASKGWMERLRVFTLDVRKISQCQAGIAEAIASFGRVDILLCCTSQTVVGTVEELAASERTHTVVRDQFETNFFGPMNIMKAALPHMREQKIGHIIVLGGITGHIGTPGLGMYCAAEWALEGFCDSIAYEIAPFNIKLTILQSSMEIGILTNPITVAPSLPAYSPESNPAPLFRRSLDDIFSHLPGTRTAAFAEGTNAGLSKADNSSSLLDQRKDKSQTSDRPTKYSPTSSEDPFQDQLSSENGSSTQINTEANGSSNTKQPPAKKQKRNNTAQSQIPLSQPIHSHTFFSSPYVRTFHAPLSTAHVNLLIAETVHAITAIGGHENPPARHIVGVEGVASVKEKLKTVSEELEEFLECSCAVDFDAVNVMPGDGTGPVTFGIGADDDSEDRYGHGQGDMGGDGREDSFGGMNIDDVL